MHLITCTHDQHAAAILRILNDAIIHTTALYDYKPRSLDSMKGWFQNKDAEAFPVVGAIDEDGELLGFASYGRFRAWPAYKYTVEHSVYVDKVHRGKGIGRALMQRLITMAKEHEYHVMIGGIDASNKESIAFHTGLGFTHAGTIAQVGFKFGRWLDLAFYQLILETPVEPKDG